MESKDFEIKSMRMARKNMSNKIGFAKCVSFLLVGTAIAVFVGCNDPDYDAVKLQLRITELEKKLDEKESKASKNDKTAALSDKDRKRIETLETELKNTKKSNQDLSDKVDRLGAKISALVNASLKASIDQLEEIDALVERDEDDAVVAVDFSEAQFTAQHIEMLEAFPDLDKVTFTGSDVGLEIYEALGKLTNVTRLELENTPSNEKAIAKLAGMKQLEFLLLSRSDLNDECLKTLNKLPSLKQIRCGQTRVSDAGLKYLERNRTIVAIDLSDCVAVTDQGLESLSTLPNLKFLKVWGLSITDEGLATIGKMEKLEVLGLNDTRISDVGTVHLANLKRLKEVMMVRTSIGDKTIEALTACKELRSVRIRDTTISDKAVDYLATLKKLQKLDLSENNAPGITDASADKLASMESLVELNLWTTKVTDGAVAKLATMKNLTWLNLDNTPITDESVKTVSQMKQLKWLHIGSNKLTDKYAKDLMKLENLKYLNISNTSITEDVYFEIDDFFAPKNCVVVGP